MAQLVRDRYLPHVQGYKRSWRTDETICRLHILPALGSQYIDELAGEHVAALVSGMQADGYSSGTTNRVVIVIRHVFNLARTWGISGASTNPTSGIKLARDVTRERFLTTEELQKLIASIDDDENKIAAKAIKLLLLTGARRNEITHAKWEHVDWANGSLLVPRSKSGKPRVITLNAAAIELLRSIPAVDSNRYIFPSPTTGRPSPSLHFPWQRIRVRAELSDFRLHDLRHSFASFLVNRDVSLYKVQLLLGHSHPRYTQRYAHLTHQALLEAADVMTEIFSHKA